MHIRMPRLTLSQVGSGALQSQHLSLPGRLRILVTIRYIERERGREMEREMERERERE